MRPALAFALVAILTAPAAAQTTTERHYSPSGVYMGKTERSGATERRFGPAGQDLGRSTITRTGRDRTTVRDRDAAGHDLGRREVRR